MHTISRSWKNSPHGEHSVMRVSRMSRKNLNLLCQTGCFFHCRILKEGFKVFKCPQKPKICYKFKLTVSFFAQKNWNGRHKRY